MRKFAQTTRSSFKLIKTSKTSTAIATSTTRVVQRGEKAAGKECPVLDVGPENSSSYTSSELSESEEEALPLPPAAKAMATQVTQVTQVTKVAAKKAR